MILKDWLKQAETRLKSADIGTARLDVLILLEDETGKDRSWLLAHAESPLQGRALQRLDRKLKRRQKHEPLAYIRGFSEFYGRRFKVNKNVLEPRPESETMVDLLKNLLYHNFHIPEDGPPEAPEALKEVLIADVGTGSGALAITAKLEIPEAKVIATDIDPKCLSVARQNAKAQNVKIKFLQGDLLNALPPTPYSLHTILANLPYVPRNLRINQAAAMEPRLAIDGGSDGLDVYRRLFEQLSKVGIKSKYVFTESLPPQHKKLADIAQKVSYRLRQTKDFIQVFEGG